MHIAIIGNGISGVTAARHIRKLSNHKITVISAETDYFFSRTALMYVYMGHMRFKDTQPYEPWFWEKNKLDLIRGFVDSIDFEAKILHFSKDFVVDDSNHSDHPPQLKYDRLILALGSTPNKFGWPGQDLKGVNGLYSFQDLVAMESHSNNLNRAVIVGGGLIGIEMAEMFHSRDIPVTMLVREQNYWDMVLPQDESIMIGNEINSNGIDLRLGTELDEIMGNSAGEAIAVRTNKGETIECGYVGLTAGVHPNIGWLKESGLDIDRGILVNEFLSTNIKDVYAIGDCAQLQTPLDGRRAIEAVWYTGRMMGETVAYNVCGAPKPYDPGLWFNSAKFFDIEYQVYGNVPVDLPKGLSSIFWRHEDGRKCIRIVYDNQNEQVRGFNLLGIRFRHEVCEKWILERTSIRKVLENLALANFDPEFSPKYHQELVKSHNRSQGESVNIKSKRRFNQVFDFLKSK